METSEKILKQKIVFTILLVLIYACMRNIPLYLIDVAKYAERNLEAQNVLLAAIGGDANQYSVFALGIAPFMMASILVTIFTALAGVGTKRKVSPKKMNRIVVESTLLVSILQAVLRVRSLPFVAEGMQLYVAQGVAAIELVTGALLIMYMADTNKKYGIGAQSVIIFVNIVDSLIGDISARVAGQSTRDLCIIFGICALVLIIMIYFENAEVRIPVQRVSIHNIYADKNYIALKFNPIGVMPLMFSTAVFMLPKMVVQILGYFFSDNADIKWIENNMDITKGLGMVVYFLCIYLLNIGFSFAFINPRELAEGLLKSGDCITEVRSGKATKRYLSKHIFALSFFSSTIMCLCVGVPLYLQLLGTLDSKLAMLPTTFMMLTGLGSTLCREYDSVKSYDSYKTFF